LSLKFAYTNPGDWKRGGIQRGLRLRDAFGREKITKPDERIVGGKKKPNFYAASAL